MKLTLIFRNVFLNTFYILLLFCASLSVSAQCPTIPDPTPTICDASGFTFSDLNAYATNGGNPIVWYDAPTGGNILSSSGLVIEGTYYADDDSGSCVSRESITISFTVTPTGRVLHRFYCSNSNATIQDFIDDILALSIPPLGSVEVYYPSTPPNPPTVANSGDPIPVGTTSLLVAFVDNSGCKSQFENGLIIMINAPQTPMAPSPQPFCASSNPTVGDLDTGTLATNYVWYQNLDLFGNPILPALPLSTPLVNGSTYYILIDDILCDSDLVPVTVNIDVQVDAGSSGTLQYCEDNIPATPFNLFGELGGFPQTTGTWTGPLATTNGHLGTVNISTLIAGTHVFTYTIASNGVCPPGISTVTITISEVLSSGTPSPTANPATFCEAGLPSAFDLTTLLDNEDPNGLWTEGTLSTDPIVTSPIDLSTGAFTPGTYNFTYTQNILNPCPEESTTVQVVVLADPNAGTALNDTVCENDLVTNYNLFNTLDNSQDNNLGTWTDATNTTIPDPLNLDITGLTVAGSPYTFNYTIDNGTCSDTEPITITIEDAPNAGTTTNPSPFCIADITTGQTLDLLDYLSVDADPGVWIDNNTPPSQLTGSIVALDGLLPGTTYSFTFDVTAIGSCDAPEMPTVLITINPQPNTGLADPAIYCENDPALNNTTFDLFTLLTGTVDAGGQWYTGTDTTGTMISDILDLNTLTSIQVYNYTYSITDVNGCTNSTTTSITIEDAPNAGTTTDPTPFCVADITTGQTLDLSDYLSVDADPGVWIDNNTPPSQLTGSIVALDGLLPGTTYSFTFDVTAIGSCDAPEMPTVLITINPQPNTGIADPAIYCENDLALNNTTFDLFTLLTGTVDAGGQWYTGTDTTGTMISDILDLNTLTSIQVYNYTYSITDVNGCTNSTTTSITIEDAPNAGTTTDPTPFCVADITTGQTLDLSDYLSVDADPGVWIDNNTPPSQLTGSIVALDGLLPGMTYSFTFDVTAIGSCDAPEMPMVTITINDTSAPTATASQEFCDAATVADLVAAGTTIEWYDNATGGTPLAGTTALTDSGTYYATQTDATTGCESSVRTLVTAIIYQSPNSGGVASTGISDCNNTTIDLNTGLDGTQDNTGTWYEGPDNTGTVVASPTVYDVTGFTAGTYQFTYYVTASSPCVDASTTITVNVDEPLTAGTSNGDLTFCNTDGIFNLDSNLTGASPGGEWTFNSASVSNQFDPSSDQSGTYTYTTSNTCGSSSESFDVTVTQAPNAGTDNTALICVIDGPTDLFTFLGSADTVGTWSPALASGTGIFDPLVDTDGVYRYTVTANSPCTTDAFADITVTVSDISPPVVNNATMEFCLVNNPTVSDLDSALTVTGVITWYEDAALTTQLNSTDTLVDGEDYYATQRNASGCESSISVQVDVIVYDTPTPTILDSGVEYCINDGPTINDLSLNITEYDSSTDNIVWYDAATGGSVISSSSLLNHEITYYAVLVDAITGCESSVRLPLTTDLTSCGKLILPDGFSPNGDGTNDTYDFDNLHILYPDFIIEIFNRYGNIVYKGNANTPRFDGTSNQSGTIGNGDLPVGVYYYIFNFNDGENKPEQGRLYLSR